MSWDALPIELKNKILEKRNEMYYKSVNIIKKAWLKYINKSLIAINLWRLYRLDDPQAWGEGNFNNEPDLIKYRTLKLIKYSSKVLLKRNNFSNVEFNFWVDIIRVIMLSLHYYGGGDSSAAKLYIIIEQHMNMLVRKLNLEIIY